jgi:hypothetical protein
MWVFLVLQELGILERAFFIWRPGVWDFGEFSLYLASSFWIGTLGEWIKGAVRRGAAATCGFWSSWMFFRVGRQVGALLYPFVFSSFFCGVRSVDSSYNS